MGNDSRLQNWKNQYKCVVCVHINSTSEIQPLKQVSHHNCRYFCHIFVKQSVLMWWPIIAILWVKLDVSLCSFLALSCLYWTDAALSNPFCTPLTRYAAVCHIWVSMNAFLSISGDWFSELDSDFSEIDSESMGVIMASLLRTAAMNTELRLGCCSRPSMVLILALWLYIYIHRYILLYVYNSC